MKTMCRQQPTDDSGYILYYILQGRFVGDFDRGSGNRRAFETKRPWRDGETIQNIIIIYIYIYVMRIYSMQRNGRTGRKVYLQLARARLCVCVYAQIILYTYIYIYIHRYIMYIQKRLRVDNLRGGYRWREGRS